MASIKDTVNGRLVQLARSDPDKPAFIFYDRQWTRKVLTRADVLQLSARFAAIMRRRGLKQGEVVCNTLPNSPERLVSDLGVILAGGTAMNGQLLLADGADFFSTLRDAACVAVILDPLERRGAAELLKSKQPSIQENGDVTLTDFPSLRMLLHVYWEGDAEERSFMETLSSEKETFIADASPDDVAFIATTSGSTGFSKLVPWHHRQLPLYGRLFYCAYGVPDIRSPAYARNDAVKPESESSPPLDTSQSPDFRTRNTTDTNGTSPDSSLPLTTDTKRPSPEACPDFSSDVYYNHGKLGWSGGFPFCYIARGLTRVLLDFSKGQPDDLPAMILEVARKERCTTGFLLPFDLKRVLSRLGAEKLGSWRFRVLGLAGQPVTKDLVKSAVGTVCQAASVFYGSTDVGTVSRHLVTDADNYTDCDNGTALPGVEIRILDQDLQDVTDGQLGEVAVRSPLVLSHYISNEKATQNTLLPNGWARTGDVGYLTEHKHLFVVCRTSLSIMRGSYLLYPGWLETRMAQCPGVDNVVVVPVPDPVLYNELCACLVTRPHSHVTDETVREFCERLFLTEKEDPMAAVPRYFLFFDKFPLTSTGKVCRRSLTQLAVKRLGIEEKNVVTH